MSQLKMMKLSDIKAGDNVRKAFDQQEMEELTASVKLHGILQPLLVRKDGGLLDGHRRMLAAKAAGLESVPVMVADDHLSEMPEQVAMLVTNVLRSDLTDAEIYGGIKKIQEARPELDQQGLARLIGKSPAMLVRVLSVDRLVPEAKAAFLAGKFRFRAAYNLAQVEPDEQPSLLAMYLSDMAPAQVEAMSRQKRKKPGGDTVKLAKVKIEMPGGACVTVAGAEVGMAELVELLNQTLIAARKAAEQYDVKTWQAMMRDRAKKA